MTGKDETATTVLDEDIVKEIVEGAPPGKDGSSRLIRLERETDGDEDTSGGDADARD